MAKYKIIPSSRTIVQSPISIGHKAEKGVEAIEFDLTAWVETYGSGTLTVIMRRWRDAIPYPIALEIDENNKATWTLSDIDTAKAGMAYAQLNYIVGNEVVKKSDIYTFRVMDSLTGEGEPPEAYESWLEHLTHLAAEAMAEVLDIEGIVTDKTLTIDGGIADAKATGEALAEKVDAADYSTLSARVGANTIALAEKADRSTTYTKAEVDQMIEGVEVETDATLSVSGAPADAKKVGDELSDIKADLTALANGAIPEQKEIDWQDGWIDVSGNIRPSTVSKFALVPMEAGETIVIGTKNSNITIIGSTTADSVAVGDNVTIIQKTSSSDAFETYTYTCTDAINLVICVRASEYTLDFYQTAPFYSDINGLSDRIGRLDQLPEEVSAITAELKSVRSANVWNEADKTIGYVAANGNRNSTSTTYQTLLHPIAVSEGDIVRFYGNNNFGSVNARFICAYDSNGAAVAASGSTADTRTYTVPAGIVGIIPSFLASVQNVMVTINEEVTEYQAYTNPHYVATLNFLPKSLLESVRPVVNIKATDTEAEIISKMVNAYNTKNCDVVFERAVYNFGAAIATVKTDYGLSGNNEIPIGNGCRYFFNGAVLNAVMDLGTLGVDFYVNLLGAQNAPSDFELHDGILKATDTRYVVHDDAGGKKGTYKHLYQNMHVIYTTNLRTEAIRKAVGGGTGQSGVVEMVGCKFVTDGTDSAVSYHGNATDYAGSEFLLNVRNCWFSNSLRAGELSANQSARLLYTGNSSGSNLQTYARWDVTSFLNEVRS